MEELRASLRQISPGQLAANTNTTYQESAAGEGEFGLAYFDGPIRLTFPALAAVGQKGNELPVPVQAILLYYFQTSDGSPLTGKRVSFGNLPGGRIYERAFQGYSGDKLCGLLGNDLDRFKAVCAAAGGQEENGGDACFRFSALPRLPIYAGYWLGEDEFPSSCKILFDACACSHLPIDVCAILGKMLVSRIIKASATIQNRVVGS